MHQMDAERMNLPDASFRLGLCGFALWMLLNPRVSSRSFAVAQCGGRVALSTLAADNPPKFG